MHCYHIYSWQTVASKLHTWFETLGWQPQWIMEPTTIKAPTVKPTEDEIIEIINIDIIVNDITL